MSEIITAKEARELYQAYKNKICEEQVEKISELIRANAKSGKTFVFVFDSDCNSDTCAALKKLGYETLLISSYYEGTKLTVQISW